MRTLKFRAWDENNKRFFTPEDDGNYVIHLNGTATFTKNVIAELRSNITNKALILEQFTGLLDKNGKEIYEGDIVKCNFWEWDKKHTKYVHYENVGYVFYVDFLTGFFLFEDKDSYIELRLGQLNPEVLGNIHENPELLK
jgi:uncharacterized phage protein (TIGR01671 family)